MGKNQEKNNEMDILVRVCYKPPNQDEETDEIFYKQLGEASPWGTSNNGMRSLLETKYSREETV